MAAKQDIGELFGLDPANPMVADRLTSKTCPFTNVRCTMVSRGSSNPTGVCALVTSGETTVVCRNRFYGGENAVLKRVAFEVFGAFLWREGACQKGVGSHSDIGITGKGKLTFDWLLAEYQKGAPERFIAIDVLVANFTGSFRDTLEGYRLHHSGKKTSIVPSGHSLDTDVEKIVGEILRKAVLLRTVGEKVIGYYVVLSSRLLDQIEEVYPAAHTVAGLGMNNIAFRAFDIDSSTESGVRHVRDVDIDLDRLLVAYWGKSDRKQAAKLKTILGKL